MLQSEALVSILILSTLATGIAAWVTAWQVRRRMRALMKAPRTSEPPRRTPRPPSPPAPVAPPTLAANQRAGFWLVARLVAVSVLIAGTSAYTRTGMMFPDEPIRVGKLAVFAVVTTWPVVPVIGLVWRWSRGQVLGAMLMWCLAVFPILLWRQLEFDPGGALLFLALEVTSLPFVTVLFLGTHTRAIAPWLMTPVLALVTASHLGVTVLMDQFERLTPAALWLAGQLDVVPLMALAVFAPWVLAWWPTRALGRALGAGHRRRWFSDLLVCFAGVWAFVLTDQAIVLVAGSGGGPAGFLVLASLGWIPLVTVGRARPGPAPTLLVLRVFQRDQQVQALYDAVVERWRLSGPIAMIAGTDLADRTVGADDVFTFLDGRLVDRFVTHPAQLDERLASLHTTPDIDGRYRVDACFCNDETWRLVLTGLVARSTVVLMDLRGFQAHNEGCVFELQTLAASERPLRVLVLVDGDTDRAAANTAIRGGPAVRFEWIEVPRFDVHMRNRVLSSLFAG